LIERICIAVENCFLFLEGYITNPTKLTENTIANGISLKATNATTTILDLLDGISIMVSNDYLKHNFKIVSTGEILSIGTPCLNLVWQFNEPIRLDGNENEKLGVIINDEFSLLGSNNYLVQGLDFEEGSRKDFEN
jgi:hypothetical protein